MQACDGYLVFPMEPSRLPGAYGVGVRIKALFWNFGENPVDQPGAYGVVCKQFGTSPASWSLWCWLLGRRREGASQDAMLLAIERQIGEQRLNLRRS